MHLGLTLDRGLPADELQQIDAACDRFEVGLASGPAPGPGGLSRRLQRCRARPALPRAAGLELDLRLKQGKRPTSRTIASGSRTATISIGSSALRPSRIDERRDVRTRRGEPESRSGTVDEPECHARRSGRDARRIVRKRPGMRS